MKSAMHQQRHVYFSQAFLKVFAEALCQGTYGNPMNKKMVLHNNIKNMGRYWYFGSLLDNMRLAYPNPEILIWPKIFEKWLTPKKSGKNLTFKKTYSGKILA